MMQDKHLYEYAVIRVLPRVEREEFVNVGVILYSKKSKYLKAELHINEARLKCFSSEWEDFEQLYENLNSFVNIAKGQEDASPIAQMDIASRFRWLTAVKSSCIQTSKPHSGFSDNLDETLQRLLVELVF